MVKKRSFANPFPSFRKKQLGKAGRSNSVPGVFSNKEENSCAEKHRLPSLSEDNSEEDQRGNIQKHQAKHLQINIVNVVKEFLLPMTKKAILPGENTIVIIHFCTPN